MIATTVMLDRVSIELTNRCDKACSFCYNQSRPTGETIWTVDELLAFINDCAANGVRAVSFGGGEPLLYEGLFEVLIRLHGKLFRSLTTNGIALATPATFESLVASQPDKVHLSIHRPDRESEVDRVIASVQQLANAGIASGINLLVPASQLNAATYAAARIRKHGIDNRRIVYLPQRGSDTPTSAQLATVAAAPFQSMTCLRACGSSPRFASISWDKNAAWCSYTETRRPLAGLTFTDLMSALDGLGLRYCGEARRNDARAIGLPIRKAER